MTSRSRLVILVLALIGLGVSGEATWIHHKLLTDASFTPACDLSSTFNCSQVYLSPYGTVRGIPVALGGVVWFGLVGLLAAFTKPATEKEAASAQPSGAYLFALSTIGLAVILSLAYASFAVLKTYCVLCLATYACVIGIFITAGMTASVPVLSLPSRLFNDLRGLMKQPLPLMVAVLFLLGSATIAGYFQGETSGNVKMTSSAAPPKLDNGAAVKTAAQQSDDPKVQFEAWWNAQPRIETGVPLNGAKVVVVKFSDFQCPGCKQTWLMYTPVLKKYTDAAGATVRYVMKDFPLNSNCNVAVQTQMHPFSCDASVAYRAAVERGKGEAMEKWIFDNQATLTTASVRQAAKDIAGITDFEREVSLRMAGIKKDTSDGGALQISSTPTFYINGVKLPTGQWLNPEYFDLAIQLELKKAGTVAPQKAGGE